MENSQLHPIATHAQLAPSAQISPVLDNTQGEVFFAEPRSQDANRQKPSRRQTIIALLNEFAALREEEYQDDGHVAASSTLDKAQGARVITGEHFKHQHVGADDLLDNGGAQMFWKFNKRIGQVDKELQNFGNAVRPLGSSVALISSSYYLRVRLQQILHLFRENAANTFKDKVSSDPPKPLRPYTYSSGKKLRVQNQRATRTLKPVAPIKSDLEAFPEQLELLARDLKSFHYFLHDIPEFTDEGLNDVILSFEEDLKYWASCLRDYEGQFKYHAVGRHVNNLTKEMDEHFEGFSDALRMFQGVGVISIRTAQTDAASALQNLSAVATFFSGMTATTIQYSYTRSNTGLEIAVNALWITSLVFSIASAINSQLGYYWRGAMYRSPHNSVPRWISIWLTLTPLVFLVVSVMAFSAGLVCFTYTQQTWIVKVLTTTFTSFTAFILVIVVLWFIGERLVFSHTSGSKLLNDIISEMLNQTYRGTGLRWLITALGGIKPRMMVRGRAWLTGMGANVSKVLANLARMSRVFGKVSPLRRRSGSRLATGTRSGRSGSRVDGQEEYNLGDPPGGLLPMSVNAAGHGRSFSFSDLPRGRPSTPVTTIFEDRPMTSSPVQEYPPPPVISVAKAAFRRAVKNAIQSQQIGLPGSLFNPTPARQMRRQSTGDNEHYSARPPRFTVLQPALKKLATTQHLEQHSALVRHLQFSPDGKFLATASWDRTAIIWKVGDSFQTHEKLLHPTGFVNQVAWSPDGKYLLTKVARQIKIWTNTGLCRRTIEINRDHKVQALTWMPSGKSFLCVEHSNVHILDMVGKGLQTHHIERIRIHDVGVTPDEHRLVIVGKLEQSRDGLIPNKSRPEKRIIVYSLKNREIESQVPLLEDAQGVMISRDGTHALISYEGAVYPEIWKISLARGEGRLYRHKAYLTPSPVHFVGPSYFCGLNDEFVVSTGKAGDIYIWDRETALLLHCIQASQPGDGDGMSAIGWNHCSPGIFMFASATHDGTVRIWTAPAPPETAFTGRKL